MALEYITLEIDDNFSVDIIKEDFDPNRPFHYEVYPTGDSENVIAEGMAYNPEIAYISAKSDVNVHLIAEYLAATDA